MAPTTTTIAIFVSGGFDDSNDEKGSVKSSIPAALRSIAGGACSLERWLSLARSLSLSRPLSLSLSAAAAAAAASPSPRVLLVVSPRHERRVRSFLASNDSSPLNIDVVVASEGAELAAAAAAASAAAAGTAAGAATASLVVADAAAVPGPWLDLPRLRGAASLISSPSVVVVDVSSLGRRAGGGVCSTEAGAAALAKSCRRLARVSLDVGGNGNNNGAAVARVASFSDKEKEKEEEEGEEEGEEDVTGAGGSLEAQRLAFLPPSSVASAASHRGSVRCWLAARTTARKLPSSPSPLSLRALVVVAGGDESPGEAAAAAWGPMPHASTAAGRALAAALLRGGGGSASTATKEAGWGSALPAMGAGEWLSALVASSSAGDDDDDGDVDDGDGGKVEEGKEQEEESNISSTTAAAVALQQKNRKQQQQQPSSFFTTTSAVYGAPPPPEVAAAISAAAAASASSRGSRGYGPTTATTTKKLSASILPLPPLSPVLKGSGGAAGGMLRFDIPRSRVHDKLDA